MLSDFYERGQRKHYVRFADTLEQHERYFYEKKMRYSNGRNCKV